jgi:primary-amine oxidase
MSPVNIDPNKTSPYGNVVAPGVLAQNHQHIFAVRIDPAVDGHDNTVVFEDSIPIPMNPDTNPFGNGYEVRTTPVTTSTYIDASPFTNRVIKITNPSKKNAISGNPVAYKFVPIPSQLLIADPNSVVSRRAKFAAHHVWVTKHADYEFWAGGEFTNQSQVEHGGCYDAASRKDDVENTDVVVWSVFGFTHNPRVEDWPVMPIEKHELHLKPADFFNANPALDVPSNRNTSSVLVKAGAIDAACCGGNDANATATRSGDVFTQAL